MRVASIVAFSLALASLSAVPLGEAQAVADTLYMTSELAATAPTGGAGPKTFFLSEEAPAAGKAYAAFSQGQLSYANLFEYTAPHAFTLTGELVATAKLGCDVAAVFRPGQSGVQATSTLTVLRGSTSLGAANHYAGPAVTCAPGTTLTFPFTVDVDGQAFAPGEKLVVQISIWWTTPDSGNGYFHVGPDGSTVQVAGLAGAGPPLPAITYSDLTTPVIDLRLPFVEPTSATYVYNWTTELVSVNVTDAADIVTGTANYTITDAANETIRSGSFAETNSSRTIAQGVPGNWTIRIDVTDFQGNVSLGIRPLLVAVPPTSPPAGNETVEDEEGDGDGTKDSPGLGLALLMVAVVALALIGRRRSTQ